MCYQLGERIGQKTVTLAVTFGPKGRVEKAELR